MKIVTFIFTLTLIFGSVVLLTKGQNDFDNPKPSTSRAYENAPLIEDERCEIDLYVAEIVSLIVAEDIAGEEYVLEEQFETLLQYISFFKKAFSNIVHGPAASSNSAQTQVLSNHNQRMNYFFHRLEEQFAEFMVNGRSNYFSQKLEFVYYIMDNKFIQKEEFFLRANQCFKRVQQLHSSGCSMAQEREIENQPNNPPNQNRLVENNPNNIRTYQYNIIPMSLIRRFYDTWISNCIDAGFFVQSSLSPIANHLNQWLQRILNVDLSQANPRADMFSHANRWQVVRENIMQSLLAWLPPGNVIVGPAPYLRGPLDPNFGRRGEENEFFEFDAAQIIGDDYHQYLIDLNNRLIKYVDANPLQSTYFQRALDGFELLISMGIILSGREAAPFNEDDWDQEEMTEQHLSTLNEQHKKKYLGKKFWIIKKNLDRSERSLVSNIEQNKCYDLEEVSRRRWSDFVLYLTYTFLQYDYNNKSSTWFENYLYLYAEYKLSGPKDENECTTANFDSFLFSKFNTSKEWHNCVNLNAVNFTKWCRAFRNVIFNLDLSDKWNTSRLKPFNDDTAVLLNWLREKIDIKNEMTLAIPYKNSNSLICNLYPNLPQISCPKHCTQFIARSQRSSDSHYADQGLFKIKNNEILCRCSAKNSTSTSPKESITWEGDADCLKDELRR